MPDMSNKRRCSQKKVLLPTRRNFLFSLGMVFAGCVLGCASDKQVEVPQKKAPDKPAKESGLDPRVDEKLTVSKGIPSHALDMESLAKALVIGDLQEPTDEERHALDDLIQCLPGPYGLHYLALDVAAATEQAYGHYIDTLKTPWLFYSHGLQFYTYALPPTGAYLCTHERYREYAVLAAEGMEKKEMLSEEIEYQYDDERRLIYYAVHPETTSYISPEVLWYCTYNSKGLRTDVTSAYSLGTQDGNPPYSVSRTKASYDDDGREVQILSSGSDEMDLHNLDENIAEPASGKQFEYASKGYLLSEKYESFSAEYWRAFDKAGRPVEFEERVKRKESDSNSREKISVQVEYDDKNRPVAWRVIDKNDIEGRRVEYDDIGRVIHDASYFGRDGDEEMNVSYRAVTYVDEYHLVVEEDIVEGKTAGVSATQYDSSGRFAYSFAQGTHEYRVKEIVLRDSQGKPLLAEKWRLKEGQDRLFERKTYSYDTDTGLLSKMCVATNTEDTLDEGLIDWYGLDTNDLYKSVKTYGYLNSETGETIDPGDIDGEIDLTLDDGEVSCPTPDMWPGQDLLRQWPNGNYAFKEALAFADSLTQKS